jgi:hypothetical protein
MSHDTGFAPNTGHGICTLGGCKVTTVERWAGKGSWVLGIGGNGTGKPNKLIYAMEVEDGLTCLAFKENYPRKSKYLKRKSMPRVLVSTKFYYFGDVAIDLPEELQHIVINRQGCKRVSDKDVANLASYLATHYRFGTIGKPNNAQSEKPYAKCGCARWSCP